jgi:hypothetical protein
LSQSCCNKNGAQQSFSNGCQKLQDIFSKVKGQSGTILPVSVVFTNGNRKEILKPGRAVSIVPRISEDVVEITINGRVQTISCNDIAKITLLVGIPCVTKSFVTIDF